MTENQEDWQLKYAVVKDRGGHIFQTGTWSDCKFLVGRTAPRVYFNAHKLMLAMASPVFEAMLHGEIAEKDTIHIPDVEPKSFKALLEYIYTDKIEMSGFEEAAALYYCGNKYMLPYLTEGCVKYLTNTLKPGNVCQTYEFAKMFDEYELIDRCLQMIQVQTTEVLNDDSFVEAKLSTVQDIFCLTPLNIENELELFNAAERYAKSNGCKNNDNIVNGSLEHLDKDIENKEEDDEEYQADQNKDLGLTIQKIETDEDTNGNDRDEEIFRCLLNKVILLSLTPQQFAEGAAQSPYITQAEAFSIIMNIASSNTNVTIPEGFNHLKYPRYKLIADPAYNQDLGSDTSKTRSHTVFRFTIPDFRNSKRMSMPFVVRKLSWRIAVNPKLDKNLDKEYIGIYLYGDYINKAATWSCSVEAEIRIVSNKSNAVHLLKKVDYLFTGTDKNRGSMIDMETILNPINGYVKNDSITIELNIKAGEPSGI